MDTQRILIISSVTLGLLCAILGFQLYQRSAEVAQFSIANSSLILEKDQVLFDLEKLSFSYDTLSTENTLMIAEIADQRAKIDRLATQVKNGNWSLARVKKEAETLRTIMKGYVVTIDSLNQLNVALMDENDAMRERVEAVQERNANLVERQENMEAIINTGQSLQAVEAFAEGIRLLSSGRQRPTNRASRTDMIRVCFTLLENRIAEAGKKSLYLHVFDGQGHLVQGSEASQGVTASSDVNSASRILEYTNERLDACIFLSPNTPLDPGAYTITILEGDHSIGEAALVLQ